MLAVFTAIVGFSFGSTIAKSAHLPVPVLMFWRLTVAAAIWHAWCARPSSTSRVPPLRRPSADPVLRRAVLLAFASGALFGINTLCMFSGIVRTRVANAEFIIQLSPLLVVPLAARRLKERIDFAIVVFGAMALCGVAIILLNAESGGTHRWLGDLFVVAAVLIGVFFVFMIREARQHLDTAPVMAILSSSAAVTVFPFAIATGDVLRVGARGALFIAALSLLSGVIGHGLQAWAQRIVPLSTISLLGLSQPAMAVTWALLFLDETVRPIQIVGMAITLAAVAGMALRSPAGKAWRADRAERAATRGSLAEVEAEPSS